MYMAMQTQPPIVAVDRDRGLRQDDGTAALPDPRRAPAEHPGRRSTGRSPAAIRTPGPRPGTRRSSGPTRRWPATCTVAVMLDVGRDGVPVIAALDTFDLPNWQNGSRNAAYPPRGRDRRLRQHRQPADLHLHRHLRPGLQLPRRQPERPAPRDRAVADGRGDPGHGRARASSGRPMTASGARGPSLARPGAVVAAALLAGCGGQARRVPPVRQRGRPATAVLTSGSPATATPASTPPPTPTTCLDRRPNASSPSTCSRRRVAPPAHGALPTDQVDSPAPRRPVPAQSADGWRLKAAGRIALVERAGRRPRSRAPTHWLNPTTGAPVPATRTLDTDVLPLDHRAARLRQGRQRQHLLQRELLEPVRGRALRPPRSTTGSS